MSQHELFPPRDTSKPAEEQGLFNKFTVTRNDGSPKHQNCAYFVLDLDHDPYAAVAMRAYAKACMETHPELAADIYRKYG